MTRTPSGLTIYIKDELQEFNSKVRRMSNMDFDLDELMSDIIRNISHHRVSEVAAIAYLQYRLRNSPVDVYDAEILKDGYLYLYSHIDASLKPWAPAYSQTGLAYIRLDDQYLIIEFGA